MTKIRKTIPNIVIILLALVFVFPFLIMFSTSFKSYEEAFSPGLNLIPRHFTLENYVSVFEKIPFFRYLFNTLFITGLNVLGTVIVTPMVAYSLSKLNWRGKNAVFFIAVFTLLIPYTTTMVPMYKFWVSLNLVGTFYPLVIPSFFGYPYYIIILRQFMVSLPDELFEAAKIDGCNHFGRFIYIALPLSKSGILTITIFSFLFTFSDFLGPLLYLNDPKLYTLSLGFQSFMNEHTVDWTGLMAAASLFVLPVLIIFIFAERHFIEGISTTGIK